MKRDMDLIRRLLLLLEEDLGTRPKTYFSPDAAVNQLIDGYSNAAVYEHFMILLNSPFIDGQTYISGQILVKQVTWEGREFLDAVRADDIWEKTKKGAEATGGFTLDLLKDLAKGFVRKQIEERTGIKL